MRAPTIVLALATAALPALSVGRSAKSPVADAFRGTESKFAKNLVASAEEMPEDKYDFKPTPAQMTFGQVVLHVADDNDLACPGIGFMQAPQRDKLSPTDS